MTPEKPSPDEELRIRAKDAEKIAKVLISHGRYWDAETVRLLATAALGAWERIAELEKRVEELSTIRGDEIRADNERDDKLTSQTRTIEALRAAGEAVAVEFELRAGKPIDNPTRPIDWANHGERMAYLRAAAFLRRALKEHTNVVLS